MALINGVGTNELPARQKINKIVIETNGAAGIPAMTGIGGHPGPPDLMMNGGPRGHHGHVRRKSTSTEARLLSGTETSQKTWRDAPQMSLLRNMECSCGEH